MIPFSGFCGSDHIAAMDDAVEMMFMDDHSEINHELANRADREIDWPAVMLAYAKMYAADFAAVHIGEGCEFETLSSPREYNFTTDRIFMRVPVAMVGAWFAKTRADPEAMDTECRSQFTSRSGFVSYYDADWRTWGELAEWDHNQVFALMMAALDPDEVDEWEREYASELNSNGELDAILCEAGNDEFIRILDVNEYIRQRAERAA